MTNRTDNFNRANNALALGTPSDSGSAWVAYSGTWGVNGNQARLESGGGQDVCALESSVADVTVQATLTGGMNGGQDVGLVARLADDNNYILGAVGASDWKMFKRVGGSFSQLGSTATGTPADGDVIKLDCNGSSLTFSVNGVAKVTATDSAGLTNTKHGIRSNNFSLATFDDFSITAFVVTPTTHTTTGALAASAATVSGTATHTAAPGTHPSSGALSASAATVAGTAAHTSAATGTITTVALKNNTGTLLASTLVDKLVALKLTDMSVAATWTSQTTNSSGILTLTGVVAATDYLLVTSNTAGSAVGVRKYTAA